MRKKVKCERNHGKGEEKGEFGNPWSESYPNHAYTLFPYLIHCSMLVFLKYFVDKEIQICIYHYFLFAYIHCDNYVIVCIIILHTISCLYEFTSIFI